VSCRAMVPCNRGIVSRVVSCCSALARQSLPQPQPPPSSESSRVESRLSTLSRVSSSQRERDKAANVRKREREKRVEWCRRKPVESLRFVCCSFKGREEPCRVVSSRGVATRSSSLSSDCKSVDWCRRSVVSSSLVVGSVSYGVSSCRGVSCRRRVVVAWVSWSRRFVAASVLSWRVEVELARARAWRREGRKGRKCAWSKDGWLATPELQGRTRGELRNC